MVAGTISGGSDPDRVQTAQAGCFALHVGRLLLGVSELLGVGDGTGNLAQRVFRGANGPLEPGVGAVHGEPEPDEADAQGGEEGHACGCGKV